MTEKTPSEKAPIFTPHEVDLLLGKVQPATGEEDDFVQRNANEVIPDELLPKQEKVVTSNTEKPKSKPVLTPKVSFRGNYNADLTEPKE